MTIWRLHVGLLRGGDWRGWPWLVRCPEGCVIVTLGPVCATWLLGDCYPPTDGEGEDGD